MYSYLALLGLALTANAHFVLQIPTSLGFNDELEATGPCGSFSPSDRSKGVTDWSVNGDNIGVLSTHLDVTWEINVALLSNPGSFVPLVQSFAQKGVGSVCFSRIPGFSTWLGQDVILQVIQHGPDGVLFQCAAIKFVAGGPDSVPGDCTNSNGVTIAPISPAPPPSGGSGPSSSPPGSPSPTTTPRSGPIPTGSSTPEPTADVTSAGTTAPPAGTTSTSSSLGSASPTTSKPAVVTAGARGLASGLLASLGFSIMALAFVL